MLDATRMQYNIPPTLAAFAAQQANFAQFPLPTENTVLAAEILYQCLGNNNAPAAGAICVVELRTARTLKFLAVASGGGTIPNAVVTQWQATLAPLLESSFAGVECSALDTAAIFYSPAHNDTMNFIRQGFAGFALPATPIGANDMLTAVNNFNALPQGEFGKDYNTSQQLANLAPTTTAIHQILAVAVAMRVNAYDRANIAGARTSIERLRARHRANFPYAGREEMIDNLEALALQGGNPNQYAYQEDPGKAISDIRAVQSKLTNAWRVADLNRFCAEPKAFTYITAHGVRDPVAGQLAMWWDQARVNRYTFPGGTIYMLPCSSCQARAADMMAGVQQPGPQGIAEEPVVQVNRAPAQRQRAASFSA